MSAWKLTPEAENDLFDIWSYIARDNLDAANDVENSIYLACNLISESPLAGRTRADLTLLPVRFWLVQPHKIYFIVYDPIKEPLQILRIVHAARDLPQTLRQR
ncbi:MAG: type II toxin-antitoxin system RelE/ParE family toxin [Candidatus Acidiferrales bacterium]